MSANQSPTSADLLRHAIAAHCRPGSWFALRPILQQLHLTPDTGPELLADLLARVVASAGPRGHAEAAKLRRLLGQRSWHVDAGSAKGARPRLTVHSGGARWTIHLLLRPQLHIETISR